MAAQLIRSESRRARVDHRDDSAEFLIEAMDWIRRGSLPGNYVGVSTRLTFSELRAIAELKANNWQIKKGQIYVKQWCKNDEGQTYTFKTLPNILRICIKHKLYGE